MSGKVVYIVLMSLIVICSGCVSTINRVDEEKAVVVNLDEKSKISLFDLFSSIELIPLETSDSILMGAPLRQMAVFKNRFYLLVGKENQLWEFDEKGHFIKSINHYGAGPGEYSTLACFQFNHFTGNLEILSDFGDIFVYDESGTSFKKKISLRGEGISAVHEFISLSPAKYLIFSSSRNGNKMIWYDALKEQVYKEDYDLPSFLFFKTPYHHTFSPFYLYGDTVHFVQGYNGEVFVADSLGTLSSKYHFDFGKANLLLSDLPDKDIKYNIRHRHAEGTKKATCFITYGENSHYYICSFSYQNRPMHLIVDKREGKVCSFSYYEENCSSFPFYMDEEALYSLLYPKELYKAVSPQVLSGKDAERYKYITLENNPIIVKYVFKK